MRFRLLILSLALFTSSAVGQVEVSATVDTPDYLIGDWIDIELKVKHPKGLEVYLPQVADKILKFEVLEVGMQDTKERKADILIEQNIRITSFDSGYFVIPPFHVGYREEGADQLDSVSSEPILVHVMTMPVDTTQDIMAIHDPIATPITFEEIKWWLAGGTLALIILGVLLWWFFFRKNKDMFFTAPVRQKPHEWALEALEELEAEDLWRTDVKNYYVRLGDIVRQYIELRFRIPALEQITGDIIRDIRRAGLSKDKIDGLSRLFNLANLAKFAKGRPTEDANLEAMVVAREFVDSTRPIELSETNEVA